MSRLALAVLVPGLFVCVLSTREEAGRPKFGGYTFYKDAGGHLMYHEMPVTFDDAKKRCAVEGGVLASPLNDGIKNAMMNILWKSRKVKTGVFTGFSAKPHNGGIFSSVEGTLLSSIEHTWAPDEPNNEDGREHCIVLSPHGTMSDVQCDNRYPYFCYLSERAKESERLKNVCGVIGGDYALDNRTGSCYKWHSNELVFDEAAKVCEQEGAHLAIVNGDDEAQALKDLIVKNKENFVILGFRFVENSGKWMTIQGETIQDAGYAKLSTEQNLNSLVENEHIIGMLRYNGFLSYTLPSTHWPFICEKYPEIVVSE